MRRGVLALVVLTAVGVSGCTADGSDVAPPAGPEPAWASASVPEVDAQDQTEEGDAALTAVRAYLREQALAVNAGTADPALVPAFTATLTTAGRDWALPLLAENLGDVMPGPYPSGVLASDRVSADRVELDLCLQDRGWQVDRTTGHPVNAAHHGTARAVVLRVDGVWLVDDVAADGGECTAADVVVERF